MIVSSQVCYAVLQPLEFMNERQKSQNISAGLSEISSCAYTQREVLSQAERKGEGFTCLFGSAHQHVLRWIERFFFVLFKIKKQM